MMRAAMPAPAACALRFVGGGLVVAIWYRMRTLNSDPPADTGGSRNSVPAAWTRTSDRHLRTGTHPSAESCQDRRNPAAYVRWELVAGEPAGSGDLAAVQRERRLVQPGLGAVPAPAPM